MLNALYGITLENTKHQTPNTKHQTLLSMNANILVVDDTPANLRLLVGILKDQGYKVRPAPSGRHALSVAQNEAIDVILLDIMMPEMDGYEVCRHLKAQEVTRDIPILFLSALNDTFDKVKAFEAGGVDYITKPFQAEEVLARVAIQLSRRWYLQEMQRRNKELALVNQISRLFSSSLDLEQVLQTTLTEIQRVLNAFSTSVWLLDEEADELVCKEMVGPGGEELIGLRLPAGEGITGVVAQHGESVVCPDLFADPRHHSHGKEPDEKSPRSMLSVPLQVTGRVVGVLNVVDPAVNHFSESDLRFVEPIASAAATAIENARLYTSVQQSNRLIRTTFGRYLSDEIVQTILETPDGMTLGGEEQTVTIMMTDIRGFTALCERLSAEDVVAMLNLYFDVMTDIIFRYQGTIDEFIGDGILVMFGAPVQRDDDAQRAVACALDMQLAMEEVNRRNREAGFPEIKIGIGIHTGEVVVGNLGSHKRMKYGLVGHNINLTARIESYTVGGQILISDDTRQICGGLLRIAHSLEVMPKGVTEPMTLYEVGGIGGKFDLSLPEKQRAELVPLIASIPLEFTILEGKHAGEHFYTGTIITLSEHEADIEAERACRVLTNLKLTLFDRNHTCLSDAVYAKITDVSSSTPPTFRVSFTSIPTEAADVFRQAVALGNET